MNAQTLVLTKEEADELALLLRCELGSSAEELHYTVAHEYRARIEQREAVMRSLLAKIESASGSGCQVVAPTATRC